MQIKITNLAGECCLRPLGHKDILTMLDCEFNIGYGNGTKQAFQSLIALREGEEVHLKKIGFTLTPVIEIAEVSADES